MTNPWLTIPEPDYIGHMSSPAVGQRAALSGLLGETLRTTRPTDVLVVGCSNGNGFEHFDAQVTRRVTCVDVNDRYLTTLRGRRGQFGVDIDDRCGDIMKSEFAEDSFDLVHAALVFEYIEWPSLLPHIASWLRPGGTLSIVVQRPSVSTPAVTPTPFTSLLALESIFRFVEPETLVNEAERCGFVLTSRQVVPLPSRKTFEALRLRGE